MKREIKVGLLVVGFIIFLMALAFWLKGNPFKASYEVEIHFPKVHGLHRGSIVEYEGFRCGLVKGFRVVDDGIIVRVLIDEPHVKLYQSDRFLIIPNSTIASEFLIFVDRGFRPAPEYQKGMVLIGEVPPGFEDFLYGAENALVTLNKSMQTMNNLIEDARKQVNNLTPLLKDINELSTSGKFTNIVNNLDGSTKAFNAILSANQEEISNTLKNIDSISGQINTKLAIIDDTQLRESLEILRASLNKVSALTAEISPEDIQNIQSTLAQTEAMVSSLHNEDPNKDFASILMRNAQRLDRISRGLEKNLRKKPLIKVLFDKVPVK